MVPKLKKLLELLMFFGAIGKALPALSIICTETLAEWIFFNNPFVLLADALLLSVNKASRVLLLSSKLQPPTFTVKAVSPTV